MLRESENITVVIGSTQEARTKKNPFTYRERRQMLLNVYGKQDRMRIFGLPDITDDNLWFDYVIENIRKKSKNFGDVEAYYGGTDEDCSWFDGGNIKIEKLERSKQSGYLNISATKIRELWRRGDDEEWKKYVPPENVDYIAFLRD
jgi:nicotinamide mononucleotide adenylyltransferase